MNSTNKGVIARVAAVGASLAVVGGLVAAAGGSTGAYFSDTHTTSQAVSIAKVAINDPASADAAFGNLLAGGTQSRTFTVQNTGTVAENVFAYRGQVTGLPSGDSSPSLLTVQITSAASAEHVYPADKPGASWLIASAVAPGTSFTYTETVALDPTAGGTWNAPTNWNAANNAGFSVTVPLKLVGVQMSAGWIVVS
jgi:hypothetical protein